MPDRITQLNALFQEEISLFFKHESPEIFFTITRVRITPDLHQAQVWVSFLNKHGSSLETLSKELGELGKYLGKRLRLKRIPHIELILDTGMEYAEHIAEVLDSAENK